MRIIAIEEHFVTPMYREKVGANEYRNFKATFPKSQYIRNVDMVLPQVERQLQVVNPKKSGA